MRLVPDDIWAVMTIWQEARSESMEGKIAVGHVIRNRMRRRYNSDGTVAGTVLRPYQFSGWNVSDANRIPSARINDDDPLVRDCQEAWRRSATENGGAGDAVLYCNLDILPRRPQWAILANEVAKIGRHTFYLG